MRKVLIFVFFITQFLIYSENVDIRLLTTTGEYITKTIDVSETEFRLSKSNPAGHRIVDVENLELLPNLKTIVFYSLRDIADYSFLTRVKKLQYLHFGSCTIQELSFLENLENLIYLHLDFRFPDGNNDIQNKTKINLEKLNSIEVISYAPYPYTGIPQFYKVKNRPYLKITNNNITELSIADRQILEQYSIVSLYFNPIAEKMDSVEEYNNTKLIFDANIGLPDHIKKYF